MGLNHGGAESLRLDTSGTILCQPGRTEANKEKSRREGHVVRIWTSFKLPLVTVNDKELDIGICHSPLERLHK